MTLFFAFSGEKMTTVYSSCLSSIVLQLLEKFFTVVPDDNDVVSVGVGVGVSSGSSGRKIGGLRSGRKCDFCHVQRLLQSREVPFPGMGLPDKDSKYALKLRTYIE